MYGSYRNLLTKPLGPLFCIFCWINMFSFTSHRGIARALVTRLPPNIFGKLSAQERVYQSFYVGSLHMVRKSMYSNKRQQSLVVHGPPQFSAKEKWERPFKLVIVESPSKCQTISKILQEYVKTEGLDHDYVVTSCMGHIRNIPQQKTDKTQKVAGIDLEGGKYEPAYAILPEKEQLVMDLSTLASKSQQLILATDDDREGEAMAWHLLQVLGQDVDTDVNHLPPLRVRFTEITPKAITESIFQNPSPGLRDNLVQAQETRRILDRLAGFTVSPVLWKKIAPGLSAGRVQSVGMALIVRRERERLLFKETEYWGIKVNFTSTRGDTFPATMVSLNGSPLASGTSDFEAEESNTLTAKSNHKYHLKEREARDLVQRFEKEQWTWSIANITESKRKLNPPAPYITSTLQQDSNNRLGLSVSQTMQTAQQLYEQGCISYMRTDSSHLSDDAVNAIREVIIQDYGGEENFQRNASQRSTKRKGKNKADVQAAHEAIRPAIQPDGRFAKTEALPSAFDRSAKELYQMIYRRVVASHMPPQESRLTTIRIIGTSEKGDTVVLQASGSVVDKPGYTVVYPAESEDDSPNIPQLTANQKVYCQDTLPIQHFTQPPPRYTEASFVQELEALGVGRPSTYAGTVKILRDRAYAGSPVSGDGRPRPVKDVSGPAISAQRAAGGEEFIGSARGPMVPSLTAFAVCSLLEKHCKMYVDPSFTAKMEEKLDQIANAIETVGDDQRISYLDEFYAGEKGLVAQIKKMEELDDDARRVYLPSLASDTSEVGLFVGPWGPYVRKLRSDDSEDDDDKSTTAQLPPSLASDLSMISLNTLNGLLSIKERQGTILGCHPEDGRNIRLKVGRYGAFLQWGDDDEEGTSTHTLPSRMRQMKNIDVGSSSGEVLGLSLEDAIQYVGLPRTVGELDGLPITAAIGPYGPYLKYKGTFTSLKASDGDVLTVDPETAISLVKERLEKKSGLGAGVLAEIGEKEGKMVVVKRGRFGMYIAWNKVNAKIPVEYIDDPSELPLEEAWELIQEKTESMGSKSGKADRKTKDLPDLPPGPKRPTSSYLHFCAEKRSEVTKTASSLGETSKELARLWAEMSEQDRKPYQDLADQSKEEYESKKAAWIEECRGISKKASTRKPTKTIVASTSSMNLGDAPKRPRSAYVLFSSSKRPEVGKRFSRLGDVTKELARMWKEASPDERKVFEEMASEDKARFEEQIEHTQSKENMSTKGKRGPSAYMLFCAENRNTIVDENGNKLPMIETTKRLAKIWNECDDVTKSAFIEKAELQKAR